MNRACVHRLLLAVATVALCATAPAGAQTMVLEVMALKHRTAEEVVPVIQPMLPAGSSVSSFGNQLIVRTTPAGLEEVGRILARIDAAPRQLLVTVAHAADEERERQGVSVSGSAGNDRARVSVADGAARPGSDIGVQRGDDHLRARAFQAQSAGRERIVQTVQVLEGNSAHIRTGAALPAPARRVERRVVGGRIVEEVVESTEYREAATGFHVRPRIAGDRVVLEVSHQREAFSRPARGALEAQRVVTTVSGRLGEWIELGGVGDERVVQRATTGSAGSLRASGRSRVLIKVEALP